MKTFKATNFCFPLNPGQGDLESVRGRRVQLQRPGNSLKVPLGPGQQVTL